MNRFWIIAVILSLGCAGAPKQNGRNIICFGDSITSGVGTEQGRSYPAVLAELAGREVINAGISGNTTFDALERLESDVLQKDPFLVIVELGGNDYLRGVPKAETLKNLGEIIVRIKARGAAVFLCDISSSFILSGYKNDFKDLAAKTGAVYIPGVMEGILDNERLKSDQIHPNAQGYELIAQRVWRKLSEY